MRKFVFAALGLLAVTIGGAQAQPYPSRPITFIVPFAAGGPSDLIGRIVGEAMRASLGQPVIVENVLGAGGSIAVGRVARAAPDGYTVAVGNWGSFVAIGAMYALPFDLQKDFEPVIQLPGEPLMVIAKKSVPANSLKELIAWLKANPNKVLAATSGVGGPSHTGGLLFAQKAGVQVEFIPYRGANPAVQALLAGQVDIMMNGPAMSLPHIQSGNLKVYAVAAATRLAALPDVPTAEEAGLSGLQASVWHGAWVPKGTPKEIIAKLNTAMRMALADPGVAKRFADLVLDMPPVEQQTPEALGALHKAEIDKWWPIIKAAGIKAE